MKMHCKGKLNWNNKQMPSVLVKILQVLQDMRWRIKLRRCTPFLSSKNSNKNLTAQMYYDTLDSVGSIYKISKSYGQGKKKTLRLFLIKLNVKLVVFAQNFNLGGFFCRHALVVLIRHGVEILLEMYILSRLRKDVRRCYSKVKVSYGVQNLCIQQERYDKMCIDFTEVANIAADDESSYKFVLD